MKSRNILPLAILVLITMAIITGACSRAPVFEQYQRLSDNNWMRFHTLWFEHTPKKSDRPMQIELVIRYNEAFKGNRIDLMATIHTPGGEQRFKEYHLTVRNHEGRLLGQAPESAGSPPAWYEGIIVLRSDYVFQEEGLFRFEIENLMSKYDNPGILEIGLRIIHAEKKKESQKS